MPRMRRTASLEGPARGASIEELMCEFGRGESINQGMAARELPSSGIEIGGLASVIVRVSSAAGDFT